jgi:hypothetical protein
MVEDSWKLLFNWFDGRVRLVDTHRGRIEPSELSYEDFIAEKIACIAYVETSNKFELSMSIIERNELTIDIEKGELMSDLDGDRFISSIEEVASIIGSTNYIICPEFKKYKAFYINGAFV